MILDGRKELGEDARLGIFEPVSGIEQHDWVMAEKRAHPGIRAQLARLAEEGLRVMGDIQMDIFGNGHDLTAAGNVRGVNIDHVDVRRPAQERLVIDQRSGQVRAN